MGKTWTVNQFRGDKATRTATFNNRGAAEWQAAEWVKELTLHWLEEEQDRTSLEALRWDDLNMFLKEADIRITITGSTKEN